MYSRDFKRQRPGRVIQPSTINAPASYVERMMRSKGGMGIGVLGGTFGQATRIDRSWFRFGYTSPNGIPGLIPGESDTDNDVLGKSTDVIGVSLQGLVGDKEGDVEVLESNEDDNWTFTAYNPNLGAAPGNTLTAFINIAGVWVPLTASPSGHVGLITATISGRVSKFPGRGSVSVQEIDDKDDLLKETDPATILKVYNYSTATFQSGKYCWIEPDAKGKFWLVSAEC